MVLGENEEINKIKSYKRKHTFTRIFTIHSTDLHILPNCSLRKLHQESTCCWSAAVRRPRTSWSAEKLRRSAATRELLLAWICVCVCVCTWEERRRVFLRLDRRRLGTPGRSGRGRTTILASTKTSGK